MNRRARMRPATRRFRPLATGALWSLAGLLLLAAACSPKDAAVAQQTGGGQGVGARERSAAVAGEGVARRHGDSTDAVSLASGRAAAADTASGWTMPAVPAEVAEGMRLYRTNYCGTCHRNSLAGTAGIFGPTHDGLRATAEKRIHDPGYTGKATTPEAYVRESIREPGAYRAPGFEHTRFLMPAYIQLTDSEVDALVQMLLWQPPT